MMVRTMATTPSVSALRRSGFMSVRRSFHRACGAPEHACQRTRGRAPSLGRTAVQIGIDFRLGPYPFDQFVELDGLLGCGEGVGGRKSIFAGTLSRPDGGSG